VPEAAWQPEPALVLASEAALERAWAEESAAELAEELASGWVLPPELAAGSAWALAARRVAAIPHPSRLGSGMRLALKLGSTTLTPTRRR
jgi:hypothetical protein